MKKMQEKLRQKQLEEAQISGKKVPKQIAAEASSAPSDKAVSPPKQGKFTWRQDGDDVEVQIDLPNNVTNNDVQVNITATTLRVDIKGKTHLFGNLGGEVTPEVSTYTVEKKKLCLQLEKSGKSTWPELFKD